MRLDRFANSKQPFAGALGHRWGWMNDTIDSGPGKSAFGHIPLSVRVGKRAMDLGAAFIGLTFLLIVGPFIALAIKLDSQGPIFFGQARIGAASAEGPRSFVMYKFRTMVDDAEKHTGPALAFDGDPRITRVGRFLRKSRLDEIPQFWNVMRGDMALVGPRPERPELTADLDATHPFFSERTYGLRPGITGPAQVEMTYEQCANDIPSKIAYDFAYGLAVSSFAEWLRMDLRVAFKTVWIMLAGRGE